MKRWLALFVVLCAVAATWWSYAHRAGRPQSASIDGASMSTANANATNPRLVEPSSVDTTVPQSSEAARDVVTVAFVLAGVVRWRHGESAPNAYVEVLVDDGALASPTVVTDARGRFEIRVADAGPFRVRARKLRRPYLRDETAEPVECVAETARVGAPERELTLVLSAPNEIRGRVVDEQGKPLTKFNVTAEQTGSARRVAAREDFSSPSGEFALIVPHAGEWSVVADAVCRTPSNPQLAGTSKDAAPILLRCLPCCTISGVVLDPRGRPLPGARVEGALPTRPFPREVSDRMTTDEDGRFELGCLDPGTFALTATHAEYQPSPVERVALTAAENRIGVVLQTVLGASLVGSVRSRFEDPRRRVALSLYSRGGAESFTPLSKTLDLVAAETPGAQGFEWLGLPEGEFGLIVRISDSLGSRNLRTEVDLVIGRPTRIELDDSARPRLHVELRVIDGGRPMAARSWYVYAQDGLSSQYEARSDRDGRFELELAGPGVHTLFEAGSMTPLASIDVPDCASWSHEIVLESGAVEGRVVTRSGEPCSGATIFLTRMDGSFPMSSTDARTDEGGAFAASTLLPGSYVVHASSDSDSSAPNAVLICATPVELVLGPGEHRKGLELVLVPESRLLVHVRGVEVRTDGELAYAVDRDGRTRFAEVVADDGGAAASFRGLVAGELRVVVCCGDRHAISDWLSIQEGVSKQLTLDPLPFGKVSMQIVDPEGGADWSERSIRRRQDGFDLPFRSSEQIDDVTTIACVPAGEWDLVLELDDGRTLTQPFTVRAGETNEVVVRVE